MSSKNQDEYTAAIREADAARKQIATLETQILEQMEVLETAEASLTERAEEVASLNSDRAARLEAFDEETRQQADKLRDRAGWNASDWSLLCRRRWVPNTSASSLAYAMAWRWPRRVTAPAWPASWRCDRRRWRRCGSGEEIITCDNCNRILYYAPKDSAPASSASAQPKMAHT